VDEARVHAEGHVVEKEPVAGATDVHGALETFVERGQREERIVRREPRIGCEVVPSAEGDADERHVLLDRDGRDRGERAVATCDAEHVRAGGASQSLEILALLQYVDVHSAGLRPRDELVGARRFAARARVHEEDAPHAQTRR
jgi:hypothetical protein